jgi:hypothetical protein
VRIVARVERSETRDADIETPPAQKDSPKWASHMGRLYGRSNAPGFATLYRAMSLLG